MDRARASTYANAFSSCTATVQRHGGGQCTSSEGNQTMAATACSTHRARDSRQYLRPLRQSLAGEARLVRRQRPRAWCRAARSWAAHRTCRPYIVMAHTVMAYVGGEILGGASYLQALYSYGPYSYGLRRRRDLGRRIVPVGTVCVQKFFFLENTGPARTHGAFERGSKPRLLTPDL